MNIFDFRNQLIEDYQKYVRGFIEIRDPKIRKEVEDNWQKGFLWPDPLIQLNPSFEPGESIEQLVNNGMLHQQCAQIFRIGKTENNLGKTLRLHRHQSEAIKIAQTGANYVLTTGTGSGKSLAYIIPIVDYILKHGSGNGIKAIIIYPMNALANSQFQELTKFLKYGFPEGREPVTFEKYTGQEGNEKREQIINNPPDILLTNYVMLELILTRPSERRLVEAATGLKYLVLDELHTYRGRQGADVAYLIRRVREILAADTMQCIGTSATLASEGSFPEQQTRIAEVATKIFGSPVKPEHIIGETLTRLTPERNLNDPEFIKQLRERVTSQHLSFPTSFKEFTDDPLIIWIESTFGVRKEENSNRLIRAHPKSITGENGAAKKLQELTGAPIEQCVNAIQNALLSSYACQPNPETGFPPFAFRLHQFIGKGENVYASLEAENERYITLNGQQFVPGDRSKLLYPLLFCRECGQEYYAVSKVLDENSNSFRYLPRNPNERILDLEGEPGFIYLNSENPWPENKEEQIDRLPDDWLEEQNGKVVVRKNRRKYMPQNLKLTPGGNIAEDGLRCSYLLAPFQFCLHCGVAYGIRQKSDFSKLASLSSEGRSTATTILALSTIRYMQKENLFSPQARKLLSFTDNRQDASLQAGHFNDFVQVALLRAALYKALKEADGKGLRYDEIADHVFRSLNLPLEYYAQKPDARFKALDDTKQALKNVLGYRIYSDLRRGWRITSPNLEQTGLLEVNYLSLDELAKAEDLWEKAHPALKNTTPENRFYILKVLLDFMRRELAIRVNFLERDFQERIKQQSQQFLKWPWAIDEDETLLYSAILFPRSFQKGDYRGNVYLSPRGGFGLFLKRSGRLGSVPPSLKHEDIQEIIIDLLENLRISGIVHRVEEPRKPDDVPGYQLDASAITWKAGDGSKAYHDPIRVPNESVMGGRTNPFFVEFYKNIAFDLKNIEAREHTAQVPYEERIKREERFRKGELPILFCSPTMELGVDIAELNVVNMRNVPPTPANYAQRSGRAGRSGQPALVFTYCSTGYSHDQYFFRRPELMVAGAVTPPRLDLANEDLVKSHIHAVWLAQSGIDLGKSLKEILDVEGENPTLAIHSSIKFQMRSPGVRSQAFAHAQRIIQTVLEELKQSDWYYDDWLADVLNNIEESFDKACERWRTLYRSALSLAKIQGKIIRDASRSPEEKERAKRLRSEAESQLRLLTEVENVVQSDFYSYRYFASEGFLPGYNFPRLPISAYIPGRRVKQQDEFLSRPRFLAISEFGPRAIVYHEGSKYVIHKVMMPLEEDGGFSVQQAKICEQCGYLHLVTGSSGPDLCENCHAMLPPPFTNLFRMQNVSTRRRERINSDEEERMQLGYDMLTSIRFVEHGAGYAYQMAEVLVGDQPIFKLKYGNTATIWRMNLGWRRRKIKSQYGFLLDMDKGIWEKNEALEENNNEDLPSTRVQRVIPFVEDRKNCLILEPLETLSTEQMATLQAAFKNAIQVVFQLEDQELAAEPLPHRDDRKKILFYEAAEGGAGVLRQLVSNTHALREVANQALELCHFNPETGEDLRKSPRSREECEAACYDCLMSYGNQWDHKLLDRMLIRDLLMQLKSATVRISPVSISPEAHLEKLKKLCGSELEKQWLDFLYKNNYRLPSKAQPFIAACKTRPDFLYEKERVVIYVDGPHHLFPQRQQRDKIQEECLEDRGYRVIRFGQYDEWEKIIHQYQSVFGSGK